MKVPLSWLREFVDIDLSPEELAHRITLAGLEVAEIRYVGLAGATLPWDPDKILIANILEVKPHPNADRLVLADVDYGGATPYTVVTGAPNLFPYKGQGPLAAPLKSVFAREGARLYDGHSEGWQITTLKGRPVRGVMSDAMLCSEKELGISEDHDGIMILEPTAPVGAPARDFLGEVIIEVDLTPNLARCLSILGVAREVAAITGKPLKFPGYQAPMDGPPIAGRVYVSIENPELCPRFSIGLIEGIKVGPSPVWMQRRLTYAGMRPINNIVDVSNYVMLELGQPTHAFDADKVHNQHFVIRLAQSGERLTTLDGRDRDLTPGAADNLSHAPLMVCDPQGPLAVAGVMGGEASEVSAETSRVLLEAAIWEPVQIRRTARGLKLPSEASHRFERGVDYELPPLAQQRCLQLMQEVAGGTVAAGLVDAYPRPWQALTLELPPAEVDRIVGINLNAHEIADLLRRLGFSCDISGPAGMGDAFAALPGPWIDTSIVRVGVPSFRQDVTILADLTEEVARVYGYDRVPPTLLADELPPSDAHPDLQIEQRLRDLFTGTGLNEVITYSLTSMPAVARLDPAAADAAQYLRISNPATPEREYMRRSLLPTLLEVLPNNMRERGRVAIFEIGRVYLPPAQPGQDDNWLPDEPRRLAIALVGNRAERSWLDPEAEPLDFYDLKGYVNLMVERLHLTDRIEMAAFSDDSRFHPGRTAALLLDEVRIGVFGELHPLVRERYDFGSIRVLAAEIDLDVLIAAAAPAQYRPVSRFPATLQDIAVVADADIPAGRVAAVIHRAAGDLLENLTLFDVYSGPQVGAGRRSLAYRLSFRAADRTLSDEALIKVREKIVRLLERELNASIRG